jgi:hypothetical protein
MANQRFLTRIMGRSFMAMLGHGLIRINLLLGILMLSGCALPTTFRVLDARTNEPIEGAVALAMWNLSKGIPGLSYTVTAKAVEAESDVDGFLVFPAIFGTFALLRPHLKVYKPGYVGWDSSLIYVGCVRENCRTPLYESRKGFAMRNQNLYLEPWKEEYSYISHGTFIDRGVSDLYEGGLKESKYRNAVDYETPFRVRERENLSQERLTK